MWVTLTWENVITAGAVIAAIAAIFAYFRKGFIWLERQKRQDEDIKALKEEQTLIIYGVLCCLKGLNDQGCNGPVTDAIAKIEEHLNVKAHQ